MAENNPSPAFKAKADATYKKLNKKDDPRKGNVKSNDKATKSKGFVNFKRGGSYFSNAVDSLRLPFIDGDLSLPNLFFMFTLVLIAVHVVNSILYYGVDGGMEFTFTKLLEFFSNLDFGIDWAKAFNGVNSWDFPAWLDWLEMIIKPLFNLIILVAEMLFTITVLATKLILFILNIQ